MKKIFFVLSVFLMSAYVYAPPQGDSVFGWLNPVDNRNEFQKKSDDFTQKLVRLSKLHNDDLNAAIKKGEKKRALILCDEIETLTQQLVSELSNLAMTAQKIAEKKENSVQAVKEKEKRVRWVEDQYASLDMWKKILEQRRQEISTMRMMLNRVKSKFRKDDDDGSVRFNV